MAPMAARLSNADIDELAAYFSSRKIAPPRYRSAPQNVRAGAELARKSCAQCHGPALMGERGVPRLAGQQVEYLRAQLRLFRAGKRADADGNMTAAAQPLSDEDIAVLADYLAGLGAED